MTPLAEILGLSLAMLRAAKEAGLSPKEFEAELDELAALTGKRRRALDAILAPEARALLDESRRRRVRELSAAVRRGAQ